MFVAFLDEENQEHQTTRQHGDHHVFPPERRSRADVSPYRPSRLRTTTQIESSGKAQRTNRRNVSCLEPSAFVTVWDSSTTWPPHVPNPLNVLDTPEYPQPPAFNWTPEDP